MLLAVLGTMLYRVARLQSDGGESLRAAGTEQWERVRPLAADRGTIFDRNGELYEQFALILDITERKRAERALRQSEASLRLLADSLPVAMLSFDLDGRYAAYYYHVTR